MDNVPQTPEEPRPGRYRPKQPEPQPEPEVPAEQTAKQGPSQTRKTLWIVGGAIGIYYIARGLWGVFTGG